MLHWAAAPLASTLGPEAYDRLLKALSLIYGIESYVMLRDIRGASDREVAVVRFMLEALIESALRQAPARRAARGGDLARTRRPARRRSLG
jgi:hypothetical protein